MKNYIKLFEEFQPGMQNVQRFLMYVPVNSGVFEFTATADSQDDMMQVDNVMAKEHPDRVWYQFDLTQQTPGGGTLINKRIVKGAPNADKYINDPAFEFDTPMDGDIRTSKIPDEVEEMPKDVDLRGEDTQPWLDPAKAGELR